MSITHSLTIAYTTGSTNQPGSGVQTLTGIEVEALDLSLASLTTDQKYRCSIAVADLVSYYVFADILPVTVKTYKSGSLQQTFTVPSGRPQVWTSNDMIACPFTSDYDHVYLSNPGNSAVAFKAHFLMVGLGS